jgi:hypothetical protein
MTSCCQAFDCVSYTTSVSDHTWGGHLQQLHSASCGHSRKLRRTTAATMTRCSDSVLYLLLIRHQAHYGLREIKTLSKFTETSLRKGMHCRLHLRISSISERMQRDE